MTKLSLIILLSILSVGSLSAQILNPVKFTYSVTKKANNLLEVHIKTAVQPHWHIYSVHNPDGGAQATAIKIKNASAVGKPKEIGKLISIQDNAFNVNQKFFENSVDFVQTVKGKGAKEIEGTIEYMVCNDHQCLPPKEVQFKIKL